jgi:hypothetical protein
VVDYADRIGYFTYHLLLDSFARLKTIFTIFTCLTVMFLWS